jgi:hypothetical protein
MKHEQRKKFQIDRDIIKDCEGALNVCVGLCRPSNTSCLQGYIQKIEMWPFAIVFATDIQVLLNDFF